MFFGGIFWAFLWVFLAGGFIAVGGKLHEWYDDRYLDTKIGGWFSKQDYMFVQIFPPSENLRSMSEMENFYINLGSIFTKKSPKDLYAEGKFYENFTFEIHSRGGQVGFFIYLNRTYLALLRSSLAAHYPGTGILECPDPISAWPKNWEGKVGDYTDLFGTDLMLGSSDMHPLKSWKFFQQGSLSPISDPVVTLISALENIEPVDYAIVQFVLRPFSPDVDGRRKQWREEINKLKKDYANNSFVEVGESGSIQVLTKQEQAILNAAEIKFGLENFKIKFRLLLLSAKPGPARMLGPLMSYFKQYSTDVQFLKPDGSTKTSSASEGNEIGFFGPYFGTLLDKWYWKKEQHYRKQRIYRSVLARSLTKGSAPQYMDVESLAAIFHFPVTIPTADKSLLNRMTTNYGNSNALGLSGQPPSNLPI